MIRLGILAAGSADSLENSERHSLRLVAPLTTGLMAETIRHDPVDRSDKNNNCKQLW